MQIKHFHLFMGRRNTAMKIRVGNKKVEPAVCQLHDFEVAAHVLSRYSCSGLGGLALFGQISNSKDSDC